MRVVWEGKKNINQKNDIAVNEHLNQTTTADGSGGGCELVHQVNAQERNGEKDEKRSQTVCAVLCLRLYHRSTTKQ